MFKEIVLVLKIYIGKEYLYINYLSLNDMKLKIEIKCNLEMLMFEM